MRTKRALCTVDCHFFLLFLLFRAVEYLRRYFLISSMTERNHTHTFVYKIIFVLTYATEWDIIIINLSKYTSERMMKKYQNKTDSSHHHHRFNLTMCPFVLLFIVFTSLKTRYKNGKTSRLPNTNP